tara:strand:+ start:1079 stop:1588 length:510 start_codon:yes stop_codon:yes gene_type:complete
MEETLLKVLENRSLYYGPCVKELIKLIARVQGKVDLEAQKVFGKHIHAFSWAFFTGLNENKRETEVEWVNRDGFSLGTIYRDEAGVAADVMIMVALNEFEIQNIEEDFTKQTSIRDILNIISFYAEGGAKHILEIREGNDLHSKTYLNNVDDFFDVVNSRVKTEEAINE